MKGESSYLDLDAFVERLILFDHYVLQSDSFREIAVLVAMCGLDGTTELLRSGLLRLVADPVTIASVGNVAGGTLRPTKGVLPPMTYAFATLRVANREQFLHQAFETNIDSLSIPLKARIRLKRDILGATDPVAPTFGELTLSQLRSDMRGESHLLRRALARTLLSDRSLTVEPDSLTIRVHQLDDSDFRLETNLGSVLGLGTDEESRITERALLDVAGLNQRLEEMQTYRALSGFRASDLPLFEAKLDFLNGALSSGQLERRFQRVIRLADMPVPTSVRGIDLHRLLEVRESTECAEFRQWLSTVDEVDDGVIRERLGSLRSRLGAAFGSTSGRVARFLTVTGLGVVPVAGPALGTIAGVLDTFVLERIFPRSGPATFVNKMYPSIHRK